MEIVGFVLSALALVLALLALASPFAARIGLPEPVVVGAVGLAYGLVTTIVGADLAGNSLDPYDLWFVKQLALDSGSMLTIFLPPLLFEMALAVNVRRLIGDAAVVMVMAVIAVAAATAAVGLAVWAASPIGLVACLMLGASVATTDPAAVITTFRALGAPRRLLSILEGESLLNDAAAIAIFTLLLAMITSGAAPTPGGLVTDFLYSFAAGAGAGLAVSWVAARIYPLLGRSAVAETSLTVALAYGAYLIAEVQLGASGVVAVVFAGLATGTVGFVRMGPRNWNTVRAVWTQIGFWANGLILLLVASSTPGLLLALDLREAALVAVVYIAAFVARAVILFGALPLLERLGLGAPIAKRQKSLILWGGVRGAVTMVLALSLTDISALGDDAQVVGALAAAFAVTTLLVNASTLGWMTTRLGLDQLSATDVALRERIVAGAIERVRSVVAELAAERDLGADAIADVERALGHRRAAAEVQADEAGGGARIPFGERLRLGLQILAGQEARLVRHGFEDGAIGPRATNILRLSAERIADAARTDGREGYEAAMERAARSAQGYKLAFAMQRAFGFDRPLRELIEFRVTSLLETERMTRELIAFASARLSPMVGADAAQNLAALLRRRLVLAQEELASMALQYPIYSAALERALITRAAIRRERHEYDRLLADGVVGPELHRDLMRDLDAREAMAGEPPRLDLTLSPLALIDRAPLFHTLDEKQRLRVARRMRTRLVAPDEVVAPAYQRRTLLHVVVSGVLEERGAGGVRRLVNGDVFGEEALFASVLRPSTEVVSLGFSRLLTLSRRDFLRLGRADRDIETRLRIAFSDRKTRASRD